MKKFLALLLTLCLLAAAGCSSSDAPTSAPEPPAKTETPTQMEAPPVEIELPEPELEPEPEPEPLVISDPVVYTGSGDNVIEIEPFDDIWVLHIAGNSEGRHFAVKGYDAAGNYVDLFANTSEPYEGYVFDNTQSTCLLEVSASGEWTISLESIYTMPYAALGETVQGSGDSVYQVVANQNWYFEAAGNNESHHFAVKGYDARLNYVDLFINTSEPYKGACVDPYQETCILTVTAENDFAILVKPLAEAAAVPAPANVNGTGDYVFYIQNAGKTATVTGNAEGRHFSVKAFSAFGPDLLVNTTDPYEGTVMLDGGNMLIVVNGVGSWTFAAN